MTTDLSLILIILAVLIAISAFLAHITARAKNNLLKHEIRRLNDICFQAYRWADDPQVVKFTLKKSWNEIPETIKKELN